MIVLLGLYLKAFKGAVGSLCGPAGIGWGGIHLAVCEALYNLGFGAWKAPWTSFDNLILAVAVGITVFYWKKYILKRKPHGALGSS